jgi:hypothetical protein
LLKYKRSDARLRNAAALFSEAGKVVLGKSMRVGGLTVWDASRPTASGSPASAAGSESRDLAARKADIENARSTALSALHNDRFRSMLAQIGSPGLSDALVNLRPAASGADTAFSTVKARYAESSD